MEVNERFRQLMDDKIIATLATVNKKGYPHLVPLWLIDDDDKLYFSTDATSVKIKHLHTNPKVGLSVLHPSCSPR